MYDDRAFDRRPVREGSATLARIGGVIRPLVDALRRCGSSIAVVRVWYVSCRARGQFLQYALSVGGYARRVAMPPCPVAESNCAT